jgi:dipeptidyl aminopeptidase/acylaminoacyl peptidase
VTKEPYSFERYLNVRMAYGPSFSPDGNQLSFLTDITGVAEVWSVAVDRQTVRPFWPEQLTFRAERVSSATFSPKADTLLVAGDMGGNERTQLYLLSADGASWTALTDQPDAIFHFGGWSPNSMRITYSSNERDAHFFDVYERDLTTGTTRLILQQDGTNYSQGYSPDGRQILVTRYESNIRNELYLVNRDSGDVRNLTPDLAPGVALHEAAAWSADRKGLYLLSNRGCDFMALAYLDFETLELTYLSDLAWDLELLALSHDGSMMAMTRNEDGCSILELCDVSEGWERRRGLRAPTLPAGVIYSLVWSADGQKLAITLSTSDDSADIWIWHVAEGHIVRATNSSSGGIPQSSFVMPAVVRYPTFDGREIPAFLYRPHGAKGPLPAIINVHGGPEGQARPWFSGVIQYLVSCGYVVLEPNVRGSSGYGYSYQSLDDVRLRMDSVADLRHAALWLGQSGLADPQRIAVMGGSYGGFMVLSAVTTYPDLWAAAVDIVGIANFVTFLENTGPWRRKHREAEYGSLEQDREFLEQISPIRSVERITAPLFVVHGANDPRVPVGEAEQIVAALQKREVPVEYLRFEDEGHGLVKRVNRLVAYPAIARFLEKHLQR